MDVSRFKLDKDASRKRQRAWADWLSDTPPPASVRVEERERQRTAANTYVRRSNMASPAAPTVPVAPPAGGVSIQINMPQFHRPQFRRARAAWTVLRPHLTRRRLMTAACVIVLVLGVWASLAAIKRRNDRVAASAALATIQHQSVAQVRQMSFTPAVPSTEQQLTAPDNVRAKYDSVKNSYSYLDTISGKQLTVSEQPLASSDAAKKEVISAAANLHAVTPIKTGWGTAYLVTNPKYNSQTVVVSVRELLVFLQSPFSFPSDQWAAYINSLQ